MGRILIIGVGRCYDGSTHIASELASNLDHAGDGPSAGGIFSRIVISALETDRSHKVFAKGSPALSPQPGFPISELCSFRA